MIPLLFFGQTVTPLVRLIYNHLSYPAHFQALFNICPAEVRTARRANFDSAALPLHLSRGRSLRYGAAVPTSIPRLCRSIPSVYLPTKLENTSPSAQASVAGVRFAMGPPCQLRFRGFAAPSQSRAFALWGNRTRAREECKHSSRTLLLFSRTAHCRHESSNFPVYN